ncbi:uncharacterized protein CXorf58 homolog [Perognathus longimembris pacificus]|uniref:uncharacterized protein CXorf58 homolog n=1 Tax=Perognathus longimembris pacificus TaxID=214514 RepID=UPI0020184064|nr:uncharacterized protein CXorf58 homolog [Perognathus longimembris pacificus]
MRSSRASGTGALKTKSSRASRAPTKKSEAEILAKIQERQLAKLEKAKAKQRKISAQIIQRNWLIHLDKSLFQLLKHTICAAEYYASYEILKKVSPIEAQLIKDPSMKYKVRFRFNGERFPPYIVFKVFLQTDTCKCKYFSGRNVLMASHEGMYSACNMMGKKKFYQQIMEDERYYQKFKVTDYTDIVTLKDYVQYNSLLDEIPASSGGRNNYWRKLTLQNVPKSMMMYDILYYVDTGVISDRLQKKMKYLLQKPRTEEMRQQQMRIVSDTRCPSFAKICSLYRPYQQPTDMKPTTRYSKQAQARVDKMRKTYIKDKEEKTSAKTVISLSLNPLLWIICLNVSNSTCISKIFLAHKFKAETPLERKTSKQSEKPRRREVTVFSTPSFDILKVVTSTSEDSEQEEKNIYQWYQDFSVYRTSL